LRRGDHWAFLDGPRLGVKASVVTEARTRERRPHDQRLQVHFVCSQNIRDQRLAEKAIHKLEG
jgi:hypothetical protein